MAVSAMPAKLSILAAFAIGLICASALNLSAGHSLGFYLGAVALAAIVIPPIAAMQERLRDSVLVAGSVIDGIGIVWLIAALMTAVTIGQWFAAYMALLSFGLALWALTMLLRHALAATLAAAIVVILAVAWLSWPVWLSPWLGGRVGEALVAWLTPAHPLLAVNHVLIDMGVWGEQRIMYRISALGQDVPYALPESVWPCVIVHAIIAASGALSGQVGNDGPADEPAVNPS